MDLRSNAKDYLWGIIKDKSYHMPLVKILGNTADGVVAVIDHDPTSLGTLPRPQVVDALAHHMPIFHHFFLIKLVPQAALSASLRR